MRHPSYDALAWDLNWDAYRGGRDFACQKYLFTHPKEDAAVFESRVKRAYYYNYVGPLTQLVVDYVFTQGVQRTGGDYLDDVDLKGTHVDQFMRRAALSGIVRGLDYVVVDRLTPGEQVNFQSRADETRAGVRNYWWRADRNSVLNWELDEYAEPYWVLFADSAQSAGDPAEYVREKENSALTFGSHRRLMLLWTRDEWTRFSVEVDADGKRADNVRIIESGANPDGTIPVVPFYGIRTGDWLADSWNEDVSLIARNLLNVCSLRDNYNYESAIEQLVMPGAMPEDVRDFIKGNRYVITCPAEGNSPFYVGPSGAAAAVLQAQIIDHRNEIHRILKQRIINNSAESDGASGISKQQDFAATNTTLAGLADECQRVENRLHELTARTGGSSKGKPVEATYPSDFDVEALDRMIERAMNFLAVGVDWPDDVSLHVAKGLVRKWWSGSDDIDIAARLEKILDEHYAELEDEEKESLANLPMMPNQQQGNPLELEQDDTTTQTAAVMPGRKLNA